MEYSHYIQRYKRIRNDLVESLKDKSMPKDQVERIQKSIDEIDGVMSDTTYSESIYRKITNLILPSHSRTKASINEQQLMEELISNDLFIKAAQLKNI